MTTQANRLPLYEKKINELKEQLLTLENVENVVKSSVGEVEAMLKSNHSTKSLCTLVVSLKREQRSNEVKRNTLRQTLRVSQADCAKANNIQKSVKFVICFP